MATRKTMRAAGSLALIGLSAVARAGAIDSSALDHDIDALLAKNGGGLAASVWLGGATGPASFARDPDKVRPTASAIKTWFLVELFAKYHDRLDAPLERAPAVLADDTHLAIAHFTPAQRDEIFQHIGILSLEFHVDKLSRPLL